MDLVNPIKKNVDSIKTIIVGSESITKIATSTKDEYNIILFDSPIPAGSIITTIDRSFYNMNMYMVKMDGLYDESVNYDAVANNLPYITTQDYKGVTINKVGTLTIKSEKMCLDLQKELKILNPKLTLLEKMYL